MKATSEASAKSGVDFSAPYVEMNDIQQVADGVVNLVF